MFVQRVRVVQVHVFTSVAGPDKLFDVDVTRGAGMSGNYPGALPFVMLRGKSVAASDCG